MAKILARVRAFNDQWYPCQIVGERWSGTDPLRVDWLGGEISRNVEIEVSLDCLCCRHAAAALVDDLIQVGYWRAHLRSVPLPPPTPLQD